jgi:hypothetical protein
MFKEKHRRSQLTEATKSAHNFTFCYEFLWILQPRLTQSATDANSLTPAKWGNITQRLVFRDASRLVSEMGTNGGEGACCLHLHRLLSPKWRQPIPPVYQTTRLHIPEASDLHTRRRENLRSQYCTNSDEMENMRTGNVVTQTNEKTTNGRISPIASSTTWRCHSTPTPRANAVTFTFSWSPVLRELPLNSSDGRLFHIVQGKAIPVTDRGGP